MINLYMAIFRTSITVQKVVLIIVRDKMVYNIIIIGALLFFIRF